MGAHALAPTEMKQASRPAQTVADLDDGLLIDVPKRFNGQVEWDKPPQQWLLATVRLHIMHGLRVTFRALRNDQGYDTSSFEPTPGTSHHSDLSQIERPTLGDVLQKKIGHEAFRAVIAAYRDQCQAHLRGELVLQQQVRL